jgi:hypothetical protein
MCFTDRPTYRRDGQARLREGRSHPPAKTRQLSVASSVHCSHHYDMDCTSITPARATAGRRPPVRSTFDLAADFAQAEATVVPTAAILVTFLARFAELIGRFARR